MNMRQEREDRRIRHFERKGSVICHDLTFAEISSYLVYAATFQLIEISRHKSAELVWAQFLGQVLGLIDADR
jgi:hypothetical protein